MMLLFLPLHGYCDNLLAKGATLFCFFFLWQEQNNCSDWLMMTLRIYQALSRIWNSPYKGWISDPFFLEGDEGIHGSFFVWLFVFEDSLK